MPRFMIFAFLAIAGFIALSARAYDFSPVVAQFEPSGPGSVRTFTVNNSQSRPIALQIEVFARTADEKGAEVRTPDYDSFIIAPPQLVLAPGESQSVRAQWVGDPALEREKAFRMVVSQLPIRYDDGAASTDMNASVAVGYKYEVAAYVAPPNATPKAKIISSDPVTLEDGSKVLRLTIRSEGTRRAILEQSVLTVRPEGGKEVTLRGDDAAPLNMKNILSGTQAIIDIPWPEDVPYGPVEATLEARYFTG